MDATQIRNIQTMLLGMKCSYAEFIQDDEYHIDITGGPIGSLINGIKGNSISDTWRVAQLFVNKYLTVKERHYIMIDGGNAFYYVSAPMTLTELDSLIEKLNMNKYGRKYYTIGNDNV